jgi:alpha-glucosidase
LARKSGNSWYVAGVNAEREPRTVQLDLRQFSARGGTLITDGPPGNLSFNQRSINVEKESALTLTLAPRGGFVLTTR